MKALLCLATPLSASLFNLFLDPFTYSTVAMETAMVSLLTTAAALAPLGE